MPSQQAPRHRSAPSGRPPRFTASRRTVAIAAAAVFCGVLAFALVAWPKHHSSDGPLGDRIVAGDDAAQFTKVDNTSLLAPPASVTRDPRHRPATISALPQLGQESLPDGTSGAGGPSRSGGGPSSGTGDTGSGSGPYPSAPAPSSSGASSHATPGLPDPDQVAQAVFDAINASRHNAGLPALRWDGRLQTSAQRHNQSMAAANTLSHQTPGEPDLGDRESDAGVGWWWAGENIGLSGELTQQAALGLETAMVNEQPPNDGHRQNILSRNAQAVGVDVLFDTAHHRLWLTEDFAQTSLL